MTDPRETLARIRKQADAATDGPWKAEHHTHGVTGQHYATEIPGVIEISGDGEGGIDDLHNGEFIAASRTDVPWLLEQVELRDNALEAVLDLHPRSPNTRAVGFPRADRDEYYCMEDQKSWPCPTVEAVTQALEGKTND